MLRRINIAFVCCLVLNIQSLGQQTFTLDIDFSDSSFFKRKEVQVKNAYKSEKAVSDELTKIIFSLYDEGYLSASVDTFVCDSDKCKAYVFSGEKYYFSDYGIVLSDRIREIVPDLKPENLAGSSLSLSKIKNLFEKVVTYCENNGYPFVRTGLQNVSINNDTLFAELMADPGKWIMFDSLILKGSSKVKTSYMSNYLDIKKGKPYDERKLQYLSKKIADLTFVEEIKPAELDFIEDKTHVYLYLDKKRASQFDGFIGIAPNNTSTSKVLLTGELNLKLVSVINRGEEFSLNWRKLEPLSQDLRVNLVYPYLLSTPFGIDYGFKLFKKDTTYLNLNNKIALRYQFAAGHYLAAFFEAFSSSILGTGNVDDLNELPEFTDIKTTSYGVDYSRSALDYRVNPRKGTSFLLGGSFGRKKIEENSGLNPDLYDSLTLVNTVYKANARLESYVPLYKNLILASSLTAAYIDNENLFSNELYRIGGLKSLRGFDEESIYASAYAIINIETRYLFERNSFVSIFWNGSWYESDIVNSYYSDKPWGFGAGVSFDSKAGIFSIYYALGKEAGNPVEFKKAKVHFGYTSLF